jgi:iron complex outermembrane receptor protein
MSYDVDAYYKGEVLIADAFEASGYYNFDNNVRPIQDLKARAHINVGIGASMNALLYVNYISDYDDRRAAVKSLGGSSVDSQVTADFHFTTSLMDDALSLTASVINLTDEDPPVAFGDLMYDGYTHNALGRMFKVGFKYTMD